MSTKTSKGKGIAVLIPSNGRYTSIHWAMSLATLSFPVGMNHFWFISETLPGSGHTRAQQREELAQRAIDVDSEYMMWIDDDTIVPATTIQELFFVLAQNPNAAICGGIYCTKEETASPIVFLELGAGPHWQWTFGDIFKCKGLGTGCMMVRTSIMRDIPKPWFKDTSEATLGETENHGGVDVRIVGHSGTDDTYFCQKVSDAGYDILAHGGVLPVHLDLEKKKYYKIPENSYPAVSYAERLKKLQDQVSSQKIIL